jgi:hypothetical protein
MSSVPVAAPAYVLSLTTSSQVTPASVDRRQWSVGVGLPVAAAVNCAFWPLVID